MILLDTSGLLAALDRSQRHHALCAAAIANSKLPLLLSPFVLAELDSLLMRHVGRAAQTALLEDVSQGAYRLESFDPDDIARASTLMTRYGDQDIGLADASIVVLAERHDVTTVLTLDERHFRLLRIGGRRRFRILPFD